VRRADPVDGAARAAGLVTALAVVAAVVSALAAPSALHAVREHPGQAALFLGLALLLQLVSVEIYGRGTIGVSAVAKLAAGFTLGPGVAIFVAIATAVTHSARRRARLEAAIFDAANLALAAGTATLLYVPFARLTGSAPALLGAATLAGAVYTAINNGLLCLVMGLSEGLGFRQVWTERFHWARFHFLGYGALAFALTLAYEKMGLTGIVAFALPPLLMVISVREYVQHTRSAVDEVRTANDQMRRAHRDTIAALSRTIEAKDDYTGDHTERVAATSVAMARRLGFDGEDLHAVEIGALLHDIGKIAVPEHILLKPGPLDDGEWEVMRRHPLMSDFILAETELHPFVRQIARSSHERIDGAGYPDGLAGEEIPLPARIVFVADAFDALTSDRPYRPRRSVQAALDEVRQNAGTQFCPDAVAALERAVREEPRALTGASTPAIHAAA
jgi:putative nucleotidyltransferase with HDIG domain